MRSASKLIVAALLAMALLPSPSGGQKQPAASPKQILMLYWYNKDYSSNPVFDRQLQACLRSGTQGRVEYYSVYLEENRFPGENQSRFLRDYLRQKYARRTIDVVVTNTPATVDFLAEHRDVLFPRTPIVFGTKNKPVLLIGVPGDVVGLIYSGRGIAITFEYGMGR